MFNRPGHTRKILTVPAALKLMRKLLKKYSFVPDKLVTDDLRFLWSCSQ